MGLVNHAEFDISEEERSLLLRVIPGMLDPWPTWLEEPLDELQAVIMNVAARLHPFTSRLVLDDMECHGIWILTYAVLSSGESSPGRGAKEDLFWFRIERLLYVDD